MQTTNYITTGGRVYLSAFKDEKRVKHLKTPDGPIQLIIPGDWNEYDEDYVKQDGVVVAIPDSVKGFEVQIKHGDTVYTHHHLCHEDNGTKMDLDGVPVWVIEYDQCYCTVSKEGDIKVLGRWMLLEPIKEDWETSKGVLKTFRVGDLENYAIVRHLSDHAKEVLPELKDGDKVYMHKRAGYKMYINGKIYFRARPDDIYCKIEENAA